MDALPLLLGERERRIAQERKQLAELEVSAHEHSRPHTASSGAPAPGQWHCDQVPPIVPHDQAAKRDAADGVAALQRGDLPLAIDDAVASLAHSAAAAVENTLGVHVPGGAPVQHSAACASDHMDGHGHLQEKYR